MADNPPGTDRGLSGIQVTLKDLVGKPGYKLRPYGSKQPPPINPDGWLGLPDPELFDPSTEQLTPAELRQEKSKGNIISLSDLQKLPWAKREEWIKRQQQLVERVQKRLPALSNSNKPTSSYDTGYKFNMLTFLLSKPNPALPNDSIPLWKDPAAVVGVMKDWAQRHCWIQLADGSAISLWNLFHFVERNPEMEALVKRDICGFETSHGDGAMTPKERVQHLMPWQLRAQDTKMELPDEWEAALPQGLVATGEVHSRRPSKWLWGMDAVRDFGYALYVHEGFAEGVMGGKYGGYSVEHVLQNPEYRSDLTAYGPDMNMSVVAVAARELPLEQYTRIWSDRLEAALKLYQPQESSLQQLRRLEAIFEPSRLAAATKLVSEDGTSLRTGSRLLFNTNSLGELTVQAVSPGTLKEQESYVLGSVGDRQLCTALLSAFLDPRLGADEEFGEEAARRMLWYINGFRAGSGAKYNPHQQRVGAGPQLDAEVVKASKRLFRLPPVGAPPSPTVVNTVSDRYAYEALERAFQEAGEATKKIAGSGTEALARKQRAAEAALGRVLGPLGVPSYLLQGSMPPLAADVGAAAEPLQLQQA